MKKVKTIIASLIVICASIFVSACSCGDSDAPQVYVTDINIKCVTPDSNDVWSYWGTLDDDSYSSDGSLDEKTGILNIVARVDSTFKIQYDLTPVDATYTQVNWEFGTPGLVKSRSGESTRSKSTSEVVEFVAKDRSKNKYTTTLTFTANITGSGKNGAQKTVTCKITVLDKVSEQPTLSAPSNIHFNSDLNRIEWNQVSTLIDSNNNEYTPSDSEVTNGIIDGLSKYKVRIKDEDGELVEEKEVPYNKTYCTMPATGNEYSVEICAMGSEAINSSAYSSPYSFFKLSDVTELSNNNGTITFKHPLNANKYNIYYYGLRDSGNQMGQPVSSDTANRINTIKTSEFIGDTKLKDKYTIALVFYPENYDASLGYGEKNGVKYFPSTSEKTLDIQKLSSPVISLKTDKGNVTVGGVTFQDAYLDSRIVWSLNNYSQLMSHNIQFEYEITKGDNSVITGTTSDLKYVLSSTGHFSIKIRTIGNSATTISSGWSDSFAFDVINDEDLSYEFTSNTATSIDGDCLKDKSSRQAGGLEVFFVYTNSSSAQKNSRRVEVASGEVLDISTLGLSAGDYKVYIRHIASTTVNTTGKVAVINKDGQLTPIEDTVTIAPAINYNTYVITQDGQIKFDKPADDAITQFKLSITQTNDNGDTPMTILAVSGDAVDGQVSYSIEEGKVVVDLYDVLRQMIKSISDEEADIEQYLYSYLFGSQNTFACKIQAVGYKDTDAVVVSSSFTEKVSFQGSTPVGDLTLNNYKLTFADTNNQNYMLELVVKEKNSDTVYKKYQFTHNGSYTVSNGKIELDLTSQEEVWSDGTGTKYTLSQLVDTQRDNYLSVISRGQQGEGTTWAIINTLTALTPVSVANTPTTLVMKGQDGKVYWNTTSLDGSYTYNIYFSLVEKNDCVETYSSLPNETLTRVTATLCDTQDTYKTYCYDVGDVLARYPDQVVAISIIENRFDKFSSSISGNFFATRISAPVLNYVEESGAKKIKWNAITNAEYYSISVAKEGVEASIFTSKGGSTEFSITTQINQENGWTEGVYTVSVVAGTDFSGSSSITTPFVITSVNADKVVRIVSGSLTVGVDDQSIIWDNICNGTTTQANYSISYGGTSPITEGFTYSSDSSTISMVIGDKLTAGNNVITITPSISYEETGFVIIGSPYANNITKWATASDLVSSSGTLQFKVTGVSDDENVEIELYQVKEGKDTLVSSSLYAISSEIKEEYILYTIALDGLEEGSLGLKVRVKSEGKISSELSSTYTATKLRTITDLTKEGEWLTWTDSESGITKFLISYRTASETTPTQLPLTVTFENGTYICYVEDPISGLGTNSDIFTFDKDTSKFSYKFDEDIFVGENTGDIYITIRAMADNDYYNSNTSSSCIITKLNKDTEVTSSNGVLSFEKYEADGSAVPTSYTLSIYLLEEVTTSSDEGESTTTYKRSSTKYYTITLPYSENTGIENIDLNDASIGLTDEGMYEIVIKYIGNANEVLDSNEYTNIINKLDVGVLSTQNGQIAWTNIEGASSYTLELSSSDGVQNVEIAKTDDESTTMVISESALDFELVSGQTYTLRVMANADDKLHSKWSETFVVKKLKSPTVIKITTSQGTDDVNVPLGTPIITWVDPNSNNQLYTYELKYDCTDSSVENDESKTNVAIPALSSKQYVIERGLSVGSYNVLLRVMGNTTTEPTQIGLLTSSYAGNSNVVLHYVTDVNEPTIENGVISWNEVPGAYSYTVSAYDSTNGLTFTINTFDTSINFSRFTIGSDNVSDWGLFNFTITANADPRLSIVSTVAEANNTATLYKPKTLENFRVKDGMLSWRISISDIQNLVTSSDELGGSESGSYTEDVITYVKNAINGVPANQTFERNETFDNIFTYLLKVRLNINSVEIEDTPTSVMVVDADGNEITTPTDYVGTNTYLEYAYDVSIEPTINDTEDDDEGEDATEEDITDEEPSVQSLDEEGASEISYNAGRYVIRLSAIGNSSTQVPIVNGAYTNSLEAYKPNAPITWSRNDSDIYLGQVQWGLSTTPQSTNTTFYYHYDYKVTAVNTDNIKKAYKNVNVSETYDSDTGLNPNLSNGYQYYRNLKDDLFTTSGTGTNIIDPNTNYRILINVIGTKDSSTLGSGEYIYLNSNACVVSEHANILAVTNNIAVKDNKLTWSFSAGSTKTRVFAYGPFNNLNGESQVNSTTRNTNWTNTETSEEYLELIYNAYLYINHQEYDAEKLNETDIVKIRELASKLRVLDFGDDLGKREQEYTLTDMLYNNSSFEAGGYQLKFQEIGNDRGVIDSEISTSTLSVEKLAQPIAQSTGWVGTSDCKVYRWDGITSNSDTWSTTDDYKSGNPCAQIGTFVWDRVIGANAYRVIFYRRSADGSVYKVEENIVTRETYYEPKDDPDQEIGDTYYISIIAVRLQDGSDSKLADNFFMSDTSITEDFNRITAPSDIKVYDSGDITWSNYSSDTSVAGYRVQFGLNSGTQTAIHATTNPNSSVLEKFDMSSNVGSAGHITIRVKTIATSGTGVLSSGYSNPITVTCLADPYVRLVDGVFNWGWVNGEIAVDPETDSKLLIDENKTIIAKESTITYSKYYTEMESHDKNYTSTNDEQTYTVGSHEFKVKFLGTGGETGQPLADGSYIASNEQSLTATKLPSPVISNVPLNLSENSENLVQWSPITNASGYKVRVFFKNEYKDYIISTEELKNISDSHTEFAVHKTDSAIDTIYFKLSSAITNFNLLQTGGELYIYVQAIGSTSDNTEDTLYLSSSYSTSSTIGIPPAVEKLVYQEDGTLTWDIDTEGAYGIKLQTSYEVEGVTEEEWDNYWSVSAHSITIGSDTNTYTPTYIPEPLVGKLESRSVTRREVVTEGVTTYTLTVVDILYLQETNSTPTSYKLTTIGKNYNFEVTATSFKLTTGEDSELQFASATRDLNENSLFNAFGKGDGSTRYKYTIADYDQLNRVRNFVDRHFELTSSIDFKDAQNNLREWEIITDDFEGSIDGKGYSLSNVTSIKSNTVGNCDMYALFQNNYGTISNLTINVNISIAGDYTGIKVGSIAINNYKTIDNVKVTGTIYIGGSGKSISNGTYVGGVVAYNNDNEAIISGSMVSATITALDNSTQNVMAGGICAYNDGGSIKTSYFNGNITSNYVGGIAGYNDGSIDRCWTTEEAHIYGTDTGYSNSGKNTSPIMGGIVGMVSGNGSITYSYSLATIHVARNEGNKSPVSVGGLVGSIAGNNTTIIGNYVVSRITYDSATLSTDGISKYDMMQNAPGNIDKNYYYVDPSIIKTITSSTDGDGGTMCDSLDKLYEALSSIGG